MLSDEWIYQCIQLTSRDEGNSYYLSNLWDIGPKGLTQKAGIACSKVFFPDMCYVRGIFLPLPTASAIIPATAAAIRNSTTPTAIVMDVHEHHRIHLPRFIFSFSSIGGSFCT